MNRTSVIRNRITAHFREDLHLAVLELDRKAWDKHQKMPGYGYGWMPPVILSGGAMLVVICPDVMADVTQVLNDDGLNVYLDLVEMTVATYVAQKGMPATEIEHFIGELLDQNASGVIALRNAVHARALRDRIVTCL